MASKEHLQAIIKTLTPYLMAYPQSKMNEGGLMIYAKALANLSVEEIDAAMLKLTLTLKFFPSIAEIFEEARNMRDVSEGELLPSPGEAWEEAMRLTRDCHVYKPWVYSCPEVEKAVKRFGKMELCLLEPSGMNTARAQFCRFYEEIVRQKRNKAVNESVVALLPPRRRAELTERRVEIEAKIKAIGRAL